MAYGGIRQLFGPIMRSKIGVVRGREHLPKKFPFIVTANHSGFLDAPALAQLMLEHYSHKIYFFIKEDYWKRIGGALTKHWLGLIPVYYGDKQRSLVEATAVVKQGKSIGIFPEGTRNSDPKKLLHAKTGMVRLSLETGAPIIPIGIINSTGHGFWETFHSLFYRQKKININIGEPITLAEFVDKPIDKQMLEDATRKVMRVIGSLCDKNYPF